MSLLSDPRLSFLSATVVSVIDDRKQLVGMLNELNMKVKLAKQTGNNFCMDNPKDS